MIHHKKKESIIFLSAIHPNCQNRKYSNSLLSYLSTQYMVGWCGVNGRKEIDWFSFFWCIIWSVRVWLFLLGILQARKSLRQVWICLYNFFLASCGQKFTQTLFSDSFTGINPENCLTLIRVFYNYFLTDNPDLHAVLGLRGVLKTT
jgi:hypothetical protein